jgi:hypothetical protein
MSPQHHINGMQKQKRHLNSLQALSVRMIPVRWGSLIFSLPQRAGGLSRCAALPDTLRRAVVWLDSSVLTLD